MSWYEKRLNKIIKENKNKEKLTDEEWLSDFIYTFKPSEKILKQDDPEGSQKIVFSATIMKDIAKRLESIQKKFKEE